MFGLLKRLFRRTPQPTWHQLYVIYTKDPDPPRWAASIGASMPVTSEFHTREEDEGLFDSAAAELALLGDSEADALAACQGAVHLGASCPADEKAFLKVARLACDLASRESGYLSSVGACATYRADEWRKELGQFDILKLTKLHVVGDRGPAWVHTHGLRQFDLPELEIKQVPPELIDAASRCILGMAEWMRAGERFEDGHTVEVPWNPGNWAICQSIRAEENEDHGEPEYALLRLSDCEPGGHRTHPGLTRFLRGLTEAE
jgi:hypothetical protein